MAKPERDLPLDHREVSRLGGQATKKKYGKSHFKNLARTRWDNMPDESDGEPKRSKPKKRAPKRAPKSKQT